VLVVATAAVFLALIVGLIGTGLGLVRADAARRRAQKAEQEARARLAESYAGAADLALQRGACRAAVDNLNLALAADHPEPDMLRLKKARAYCALHDMASATRELDELSKQGDLGALEGLVLLWRADLMLGQSSREDVALKLVDEAIARGLPPADAEYA